MRIPLDQRYGRVGLDSVYQRHHGYCRHARCAIASILVRPTSMILAVPTPAASTATAGSARAPTTACSPFTFAENSSMPRRGRDIRFPRGDPGDDRRFRYFQLSFPCRATQPSRWARFPRSTTSRCSKAMFRPTSSARNLLGKNGQLVRAGRGRRHGLEQQCGEYLELSHQSGRAALYSLHLPHRRAYPIRLFRGTAEGS